MPSADKNIETRLAIVEHDVAQLREQIALASADATAARGLAASADHDVSEVRAELRAHTQALNALHEVQFELGTEMRQLGKEMREGFAEQDRKIDEQGQEMRAGFATLATGMAQITALLTKLSGTGRLS